MSNISKYFLTFFTLAILFSFVGGRVGVVHAQEVGCYTYQALSGSTVSVDLKTSSGQTSTITIPNQNPPSILQEMDFYGNESCAWSYYGDDSIGLNFLTNTGTTSFNGYPEPMSDYDSEVSQEYPANYSDWLSNNFYIWFDSFSYNGLSDIPNTTDENAIISTIAKTGQFSMQSSVINPYEAPYTQNMSVSATNCVQLGGTGPKKIVFMRGSGWSSSVADYMTQVESIINDGYKSIDPFKTYQSQFTFEADLNPFDQSNLTVNSQDTSRYASGSGQAIMKASSCGNSAAEYVFLYNDSARWSAYAEPASSHVVFINLPRLITEAKNDSEETAGIDAIAKTVIHETGHEMGFLTDEYLVETNASNPTTEGFDGDPDAYSNCTVDTRSSYSYDGYMYGGTNVTGCSYLFSSYPTAIHGIYYRPSTISIMNEEWTPGAKFNVISCGYLVAAILGKPISGSPYDQQYAQVYWPTCENMDTIKDGYAPITAAPAVDSIDANDTNAPNAFDVSGSGFSTNGNSIKLTAVETTAEAGSSVLPANAGSAFNFVLDFFKNIVPKAHGQTQTLGSSYEIDGISSSGGSHLTFTVPTSTPDGTYIVSIASASSLWATTTETITVSGNGAGDPTTALGTGSGSGTSTGTGSGGTGTGGTTSTGLPTTVLGTPGCPSGDTMSPNGIYVNCLNSLNSSSLASTICPTGYVAGGPIANPNYYKGIECNPILTPSGFTASAGLGVNFGTVSLSWRNPTYATNATGITIEHALSSSGPWSTMLFANNLSPSTISAVDNGFDAGGAGLIDPGTTVYYRVYVKFTGGNGPYSTVSVQIPSANPYPAPITHYISTVPGSVSLEFTNAANGATSVLSQWGSVSAAIERSTSSSTGFTQIALDADSTIRSAAPQVYGNSFWKYTDTTAPSGVTLYYRARYVFPNGDYGPYSEIESVMSSIPTPVVLSIKTKAETSLELSWTINTKIDNGNPSITINSSATSTPLTTLASTTLSYTVSNLVPSTQYCYTVNLIYNPVNITPSTQVCATTSKSVAPSSLSAKASGQSVNLSWSSNGLTGNTAVERSVTKTTGFIQISTATSTSYVDNSGLAPATTYYYRIRKIYSDGSFGVYSSVVSVKTTTATASTKTTATADVVTEDGTTDTSTTTNTIQSATITPTNTIPTSVSATVIYSCNSGYVLDGSQCTLTTTISATIKNSCQVGYVFINNVCKNLISTKTPSTSYTCPNGYTLSGNTCTSTSVTVPATATYSCPTGFSLDNTTKTCTQPVSDAFATSTTTASVFDSMVGWMTGWFK